MRMRRPFAEIPAMATPLPLCARMLQSMVKSEIWKPSRGPALTLRASFATAKVRNAALVLAPTTLRTVAFIPAPVIRWPDFGCHGSLAVLLESQAGTWKIPGPIWMVLLAGQPLMTDPKSAGDEMSYGSSGFP